MRRMALTLLLLSLLLLSGAAAGSAQENATDSEEPEIISGLDDPDLRLIDAESLGDRVELTIEADRSKNIQVLDAFSSGGDEAALLTPETRSLGSGTNTVRLEAETFSGTHVINIQGDGRTAQIPVDSGGVDRAETTDARAALSVLAVVSLLALLFAWYKKEFEGTDVEREE